MWFILDKDGNVGITTGSFLSQVQNRSPISHFIYSSLKWQKQNDSKLSGQHVNPVLAQSLSKIVLD